MNSLYDYFFGHSQTIVSAMFLVAMVFGKEIVKFCLESLLRLHHQRRSKRRRFTPFSSSTRSLSMICVNPNENDQNFRKDMNNSNVSSGELLDGSSSSLVPPITLVNTTATASQRSFRTSFNTMDLSPHMVLEHRANKRASLLKPTSEPAAASKSPKRSSLEASTHHHHDASTVSSESTSCSLEIPHLIRSSDSNDTSFDLSNGSISLRSSDAMTARCASNIAQQVRRKLLKRGGGLRGRC